MKSTWILLLVLSATAFATDKPASDEAVIGSWEGQSICTVKDSPCHDEHVVYEIQRSGTGLKIDAYKMVNGEKDFMGALPCTFDASTSLLHCSNPGDWNFKISGAHMEGTLHLTDSAKTLYRRVTLDKH